MREHGWLFRLYKEVKEQLTIQVSTNSAATRKGNWAWNGAGANKAVGNTIRRRGLVRAAGCMKHTHYSRGRALWLEKQRSVRDSIEGIRAVLKQKTKSGRLTCRVPGCLHWILLGCWGVVGLSAGD